MLLISVTANSGECTNNFTSSLDDLRRLSNIVFLPPNERNVLNFFAFEQWIFPNLQFGCDRNLSRIRVRVNTCTTEGRPSPQLSIWEFEDAIGDNVYRNINSTSPTTSIGPNSQVIYTFEPPLAITERQFVGFKFDNNGTDLTGHTIAFVDVGEGNAPVSVHASAGQGEDFIQFQDGNPFVTQSTRYITLISAEFGESCIYKL